MATAAEQLAQLEETANTLTEEEAVPVKLRCSNCNKIAFNAFRTPCCSQNICANCESLFPRVGLCPVCSHDWTDPTECLPSKNLRLTVAQFLKGIRKKRERAQEVFNADAAPSEGTPAQTVPFTLKPSQAQDAIEGASTEGTPAGSTDADVVPHTTAELPYLDLNTGSAGGEANQDGVPVDVVPSVEEPNGEGAQLAVEDNEDAESDSSEFEIVTGDENAKANQPWENQDEEEEYADGQWQDQDQNGALPMNGQGFLFPNGQMMPNMGMFTPDMMNIMMQQMQQMQNGNFSMMGMPGMNMDMSAMYGAFGMGGMGPNMMNMDAMANMMSSMGFGGGSFENGVWQDPQMGGDGFGADGFYPDAGYDQSSHQGNYPHHMSRQHHFSKNNRYDQSFSSRGSFGNRGRGNHNQGYRDRGRGQQDFGGPPPNAPTGPKAHRQQQASDDSSMRTSTFVHQRRASKIGSEHRLSLISDTREGALEAETNADMTDCSTTGARDQVNSLNDREYEKNVSSLPLGENPSGGNHEVANGSSSSIRAVDVQHNADIVGGQSVPEPGMGWRGRGNLQIVGNTDNMPPTPTTANGVLVEGAPSGPKAMREGGMRTGRGRPSSNEHSRMLSEPFSNAARPEGHFDDHRRSRTPSLTRNFARSRSRSRSRHRSRRHNSQTPEYESANERDRKETKRRRSRRENDGGDRRDDVNYYKHEQDEHRSHRREKDKHRSSRSHREKSKERRKEKRRSRSREPRAAAYDEDLTMDMDDGRSKDKHRRREKDNEKYRDRSRDKYRDSKENKRSRHGRSGSTNADGDAQGYRRDTRNADMEQARESRRESIASNGKAARIETVNPLQKQLEQGFRIHGRARDTREAKARAEAGSNSVPGTPTTAAPETNSHGVGSMQPPSGPRADRSTAGAQKFKLGLAGINTKHATPRRSSLTASPSTTPREAPKPAAPADPYEEERRKAQEARIAKELSRRKRGDANTHGSGDVARKRSWVEEESGKGSGKRTKRDRKLYEDDEDLATGGGKRDGGRWR